MFNERHLLHLVSFCCMVLSVAASGREVTVEQKNARNALQAGDGETALTAASAAVQREPNNASNYLLRGEAFTLLRKNEEALQDFNRALELNPKLYAARNQRGGIYFKLGKVKEALADFDAYIEAVPKGFEDHWRRGIALYYAGRAADGVKQFEAGEKAFGNDVENAFWHYLCSVKVMGLAKSRENILRIGHDSRVPMMKIYALIQGKAKPEDVLAAVEKAHLEKDELNEALFYAHLYIGLNYDVEGKTAKAREHLDLAVNKYPISHYMWDVARLHWERIKK